MDDIHLLAYSQSIRFNCEILKKAHEIYIKWAHIYGASFAPAKYELIHLTQFPKRFDLIKAININTNIVQPKKDLRILNLQLNNKLK